MPPKIDDVLTCVALGLAAISAVMSMQYAANMQQKLQPLLLTLSATEYGATAGAVGEDPENPEIPVLPRMPDDKHSGGHPRTAHLIASYGEQHQVR